MLLRDCLVVSPMPGSHLLVMGFEKCSLRRDVVFPCMSKGKDWSRSEGCAGAIPFSLLSQVRWPGTTEESVRRCVLDTVRPVHEELVEQASRQ